MKKQKDFDWEGALLADGWETESTSYQMMARRGTLETKWHSHWSLVHDEALRIGPRKEVTNETAST